MFFSFYPKISIYRKLGFYKDQQGILTRYLHEQSSWNEHLTNTKNFILEAVSSRHLESIAILGSGWLLDIPVMELARSVKNWIYLILDTPLQSNKCR